MCVGWQDCEYGAPEIDPKRPFGNSGVYQILGEVADACGIGGPDDIEDMPEDKVKRLQEIYEELETALQVVLATTSFQCGRYTCDDYGRGWRLEDPL